MKKTSTKRARPQSPPIPLSIDTKVGVLAVNLYKNRGDVVLELLRKDVVVGVFHLPTTFAQALAWRERVGKPAALYLVPLAKKRSAR